MLACLTPSRDSPRATHRSPRDSAAGRHQTHSSRPNVSRNKSQKSHSWTQAPVSLQRSRGCPTRRDGPRRRDAPRALPQRILPPTSSSRTHRYARGCPSRSRPAAPSPTTQTTDLIFLFLNTQRSFPSVANPPEHRREIQSDLCYHQSSSPSIPPNFALCRLFETREDPHLPRPSRLYNGAEEKLGRSSAISGSSTLGLGTMAHYVRELHILLHHDSEHLT